MAELFTYQSNTLPDGGVSELLAVSCSSLRPKQSNTLPDGGVSELS